MNEIGISNFWWAVLRVLWKLGVLKPYYLFNEFILYRLAGIKRMRK